VVKGLAIGGFKGVTDVARGLDNYFELNKLPKERNVDDSKIFSGGKPNNQLLTGVVAPFSNLIADIDDLGKSTSEHISTGGKSGFIKNDSFFGVQSKQHNPKIETALGLTLQGKPVDTNNQVLRGSIYGDIILAGGLISAGISGPKTSTSKPTPINPTPNIIKVSPGNVNSITLRPPPPRNMFSQDVIVPSLTGSIIRLGSGNLVKTPGGFKTPPTIDPVFKTKGGGSFVKKSFVEPKGKPNGKGQQQTITKQKIETKTLEQMGVKLKDVTKTQTTKNDILHKRPKTTLKKQQESIVSFESVIIPKAKVGQKTALDFIVKQKTGSKLSQKQGLKQPPKLTTAQVFKQTQPQVLKQDEVFAPALFTAQTFVAPPYQRPPPITQRRNPPFGGIPLFPVGGRGTFTGQTKGSVFKKFTTTAISGDINIKRLPGNFLRTSRSKQVFTKLDKLDKKEQSKTRNTFLWGGRVKVDKKGKAKDKKKEKGLPIISGSSMSALGFKF